MTIKTTGLTALLVAGTMALAACTGNKAKNAANTTTSNDTLTGKIQLSGAFALYPMAVRWAEEFRKIHPNVKIDISGGGAGKGMTDVLTGMVDIGMVSREIYPEERAKGAFPIPVVKDAVVPTTNARNPELATIRRKGLSRETARKLWTGAFATWGQVLGTPSTVPVHVYTRSDACGAAETFAAWFGLRQEHLTATAVFGDPGIAATIQKDRAGIGFNNIAYVYDQRTRKPFESIAVVPIDIDGNGRIAPDEDFYATAGQLVKAIGDGRFPSPPARDLYMVTKRQPTGNAVREFLRFILTEGQQYAGETGFIGLQKTQLNEVLQTSGLMPPAASAKK